jgi:hypothetical protein
MKLTDTQLVLLSAASQREDGAVVLAPNLKGGAASKVVGKLLRDGRWTEFAFSRDRAENHACAISRRPGQDDQTSNLEGGKQPDGLAKAQASYVMWWPGCCFVLPFPLNSFMRPAGTGKYRPLSSYFH